jgi:hypothetical protein
MKEPSNLEIILSCLLGGVLAAFLMGIFILKTQWY